MSDVEPICDVDAACSVFGDEHRRRLLRCLQERGGTAVRAQLAQDLADRFERASTERLDTHLHHVHLPTLAEENALHYERGTGVVSMTERGTRFLELLDAFEEILAADTPQAHR